MIGAGSVVTRDIPANVVAFGNPCAVKRAIGEHDREYFYKNEKIDYDNLNKLLDNTIDCFYKEGSDE